MLVIGRDNADFAACTVSFFVSRYIYVTWDQAQHNCFTNGSKMRVVLSLLRYFE